MQWVVTLLCQCAVQDRTLQSRVVRYR